MFNRMKSLFSTVPNGALAFLAALFILAVSVPDVVVAAPLRLATTTSTDNSGLLKEILPEFTKATGYPVHVIAVGTGKSLRLGMDGNVDAVLVHARKREDSFVADGYGVERHDVMYNDFVIVGPGNDPAGIKGMTDAAAAMGKIAAAEATFVSRGDDSGTHIKERSLWQAGAVTPKGRWYMEVGQGMGKVLLMAGELDGYTLTDRGTWLSFTRRGNLTVLVEGDSRLFNPYGIIAVNPKRHPGVNHAGARALIDWLTGAEGQQRIGAFRIGGEQLFIPSAGN